MSTQQTPALIDPEVWEKLQEKLDDDQRARDTIRDLVQGLEKQEKVVHAHLTNSFSSAAQSLPTAIAAIQNSHVKALVDQIKDLNAAASLYPYYKFNGMWSRQMQDAVYAITMCGWLGGFGKGKEGELLTIDEVGQIMNVPINVKDRDTFHLTIEEYLHGIISLIDDLARLSRISVTLGNYSRPILISHFVKDLYAGFQILNLKNDSLRKRYDGLKYRVREIEDVVYDLSLRGLVPAA